MKKVITLVLVLSLVLSFGLISSGCARATQRAVQSAITRELAREGVTVSEDGEEVIVKQQTDSGETEMSWGSTSLPEGIPSEVPIYPVMNIQFSAKESGTSGDSQSDSFQIVAESSDSIDKVLEWFKSQFQGWDEQSTSSWSSDDTAFHSISAQLGSISEGGRLKVELGITEIKDENMINISYYIEKTTQ